MVVSGWFFSASDCVSFLRLFSGSLAANTFTLEGARTLPSRWCHIFTFVLAGIGLLVVCVCLFMRTKMPKWENAFLTRPAVKDRAKCGGFCVGYWTSLPVFLLEWPAFFSCNIFHLPLTHSIRSTEIIHTWWLSRDFFLILSPHTLSLVHRRPPVHFWTMTNIWQDIMPRNVWNK